MKILIERSCILVSEFFDRLTIDYPLIKIRYYLEQKAQFIQKNDPKKNAFNREIY